jgi:hypothetical protein
MMMIMSVFCVDSHTLHVVIFHAFVSLIATVQRFEITMRCAICNVSVLDPESWKAHLRGKRHLRSIYLEEQKRDAELKGIYVRGLFSFVFPACCIQATWL